MPTFPLDACCLFACSFYSLSAHVQYCRLTGLSKCPLASLLLCCSVLCPASVSTRACLASAYCLTVNSTMYSMVILSAALLSICISANLLFSIQNLENACPVYLSAALLSICISVKLFYFTFANSLFNICPVYCTVNSLEISTFKYGSANKKFF
jgi:hypothetical protein